MNIKLLAGLLMLLLPLQLWAIDASEKLADPKQQAMYETITKEVRCLVCQNQPIADSTAPLAADLRREIKRMIVEGKSESQIKDYLVERYSDFILYKPRFRSWSLLLWLAPIAFLLIGSIALLRIVSRRTQLPINEDAP
jgi:cytochrome c-type biogenesis protein CcmH